MAAQMGTRLIYRWLPGTVVALGLLSFVLAGEEQAEKLEKGAELDPLGANAACYVCHIPFVKEELSRDHLREKITCVKCHGLSADHANDEDIGATSPDVKFGRKEIAGLCRECHPKHDVPAREVVARFHQRRLSPQRSVVCTDCHGHHRIERAADAAP